MSADAAPVSELASAAAGSAERQDNPVQPASAGSGVAMIASDAKTVDLTTTLDYRPHRGEAIKRPTHQSGSSPNPHARHLMRSASMWPPPHRTYGMKTKADPGDLGRRSKPPCPR
jgi:hypothetical protein